MGNRRVAVRLTGLRCVLQRRSSIAMIPGNVRCPPRPVRRTFGRSHHISAGDQLLFIIHPLALATAKFEKETASRINQPA